MFIQDLGIFTAAFGVDVCCQFDIDGRTIDAAS